MLFSHPTALKVQQSSRWIRLVAAVGLLSSVGVLGGFALSALERPTELDRYRLNNALYSVMTESVDFEHCHDPEFAGLTRCQKQKDLGPRLRDFFARSGNELEDQKHWTFQGAFFFMLKLASTVGYGMQGSPLTVPGQMLTMALGFVVIPLFGYTVLMSATSLLSGVVKLVFPWRREEELTKTLWCIFALIILGILWFGGAAVFWLLEGWSYTTSLYVCFVTLSTVGFSREQPSMFLSRMFFAVYIFFSLGLSTGLLRHAARNVEAIPILRPGLRSENRTFRLHPLISSCLLLSICVVGGFVFWPLEREEELASYQRHRELYEEFKDLAFWDGCKDRFFSDLDICRNREFFHSELKKFFGPHTENAMVDQEHWTFLGSAFFTLSLASTVGYGSQTPETEGGRIMTVAIGIVSIPVFGYAMLQWAHFIALALRRFLERWFGGEKWTLEIVAHVCLLATFWVLGTCVFVLLESWTFVQALYFCFVTISSAGFACVVPYTLAARAFTVVYILGALGITASMISLAVRRIEGQLEGPSESPADGGRSEPHE